MLRKQLGSAEKALQGTFLDTKKTRSLVARIRKVLSGAMGAISEDVRSTIKRLIDDLRQMQEKSSVDVTRFQKTARGQFALAGAAGGARGVVDHGRRPPARRPERGADGARAAEAQAPAGAAAKEQAIAPPTARFQIAFDDDTLEPDPTWTDMDDLLPVAEYSIDRGRTYELDRVDAGRATVRLHDLEGVLDPTNAGGAYFGDIQPLKQARLALWNPVLEDWYTRFRGFVSSYEYDFDPSQLVNRVTISLVDIFEIVNAIQMFPGYFGDPPPATSRRARSSSWRTPCDGDEHGMQRRVVDIIGDVTNSSFSLG